MNFLNGWKTAIGAAGLLITTFLPKLTPIVDAVGQPALDVGTNIAGVLAFIGIVHKLVKRSKAKP